jgi:hypothetical protein
MYKLLELLEVEADGISRQSKHEDGKFVSPRHRPPSLTAEIPVTHFY